MSDTSETPFASLPPPPYYVVTFSSTRTDGDHGYGAMAERMGDLARQQPGFLGIESARDSSGFGITNSYWQDEQSIIAWKQVVDHLVAQRLGQQRWYTRYNVRVGRIERSYSFSTTEK